MQSFRRLSEVWENSLQIVTDFEAKSKEARVKSEDKERKAKTDLSVLSAWLSALCPLRFQMLILTAKDRICYKSRSRKSGNASLRANIPQ